MVEWLESIGQKIGPATLGVILGSVGVIVATYALMKYKGIKGGLFDGIKIGAHCGFCRPFWLGVGSGIIGTVLLVRVMTRE